MRLAPISMLAANAIYDLLVRDCGADARPSSRESFVIAVTDRVVEYRFSGHLGFGGKFWNSQGQWRVSCYPEDLTPEREAMIERCNIALLALQSEVARRGADA